MFEMFFQKLALSIEPTNINVTLCCSCYRTEICLGRTFTDRCIELRAEGKLDTSTASMAKYWCTDLQNKVADQCVQLHGGWGYMWEFPVCKAFVDGRVQKIYGGTNEIMKELIARDI